MLSLFLKRSGVFLVLGVLAAGSFGTDASGAEKLTIAYIGDEIGRLEPCG